MNDQNGRLPFTSVLRNTLDSIQEFRVVTTTANDFFNNSAGVERAKLVRNIFGGSVGGPIKKDRTFYLANYEARRDASEGSAVCKVPNDSMRNGFPRLKDLKDQQLYRFKDGPSFGSVNSLFREGFIDALLIREQWDPMARVAVSLRDQTAPAHVILRRLASSSKDRLSKAITALGRLLKTTYILQYLHDDTLRERVHRQLNRGESRHQLARRLFFANQGAFRKGYYAEIMNKVSALSLLSNAALAWNTVQIGFLIDGLKARGEAVSRETLARVSPLRPPPHHPERNLPISGPAASLRVIFHTVAAQAPSRRNQTALPRSRERHISP